MLYVILRVCSHRSINLVNMGSVVYCILSILLSTVEMIILVIHNVLTLVLSDIVCTIKCPVS